MTSSERLLEIFLRLFNGEQLSLQQLMTDYNISQRSAQRDIKSLKKLCTEFIPNYTLQNKSHSTDYQLICKSSTSSYLEVFLILKILLASRAFNKDELLKLINYLNNNLSQEDKKLLNILTQSELFHYRQVSHEKPLFKTICLFLTFIHNKKCFTANYCHAGSSTYKNMVGLPLSIMFSENYFYLRTFVAAKNEVINYRIDRFTDIKEIDDSMSLPKYSVLEDGHQRIKGPLMYTGRETLIQFSYSGPKDLILDKFPDAKITQDADSIWMTVATYTFDTGIIYWILSQGSKIKVLSPPLFKKKIQDEIFKMNQFYQ